MSLQLTMTGPDRKVDDLANLKITVTVTNIGNGPVTLVADPSSIITKQAFTEKFRVSSAFDSNKGPKYKGIQAKLSLERAVSLNLLIILEPGKATWAEHDLSRLYDFTSCGPGEYIFEPIDILHAIDPLTEETYVVKPASTASLQILISADKLSLEHEIPKGSDVSDFKRQVQLTAAIQAAEDFTGGAVKYLENMSGATLRYETWFGVYDEKRKEKVQRDFEDIRKALPSATFADNGGDKCYCGCKRDVTTCTCADNCPRKSDPCGCQSVYGFVLGDDPTIYLAKMFWDGPVIGTNSKAGTIIHELSHLHCEARDRGYGTRDCKDLAVVKPHIAVINADSHQYFAENTPYLN